MRDHKKLIEIHLESKTAVISPRDKYLCLLIQVHMQRLFIIVP